MRVTTADLREALKATAPAIAGRPSMPILAAVRVLVQAGEVTLSATDYEVWIASTLAGSTLDDGEAWSALVSHRMLSTIVRVIKAKEVDLAVDAGKLTITAGAANWTTPALTGALPNDPAMPSECATISAEALCRGLRIAAPAASAELALPALCAVELVGHGDYLRFTCTDRYRVHVADVVFERLTDQPIRVCPPARVLAQIAENLTGTVTLRADAESGLFGVSDEFTSVLIRMTDAQVPNVMPLLEAASTNGQARTTLVPGDLIDALRAAQPTEDAAKSGSAKGEKAGVLLTISAEGCTVASAGLDGTSSIAFEVADHEGAGLVLRASADFLIDALAAVGGDTVQVDWVSPTKPALITSSGQPGRCLVMPIRDAVSRWLTTEKA